MLTLITTSIWLRLEWSAMRMWQPIRTLVLDRHSHNAAYAAVVVAGSYEEAGDQGRFRVEAGDVLLHDRFEAHIDRFSKAGAVVLNLPLLTGDSFKPGAAKVVGADLIVSAAERSRAEATGLLLETIQEITTSCIDWPDELATALMQNSSLVLSTWAQEQGLAPWTVSRGFAQVFGISPEAFRARTRTRHAWKAIQRTNTPLAEIAADLGFSDQAHMTRSVKQMTGMPCHAWRALANGFKTV
ncbi:MAG: AraC family transcriptional regulator [Terriglobales bacterium]